MSPFVLLGWLVLIAVIAYFTWNYFSFKRMAKQIDNATFKEMMLYSQIIDLRDPRAFQNKHILGARNFPYQQFNAAMKSLRKDKPILLYENANSRLAPRAVKKLKKAGYTDLYLLKNGIDYWDGKTK
ncbi:rhodanese-like domain-containing protein [Streptococcus didelphis]|uniref:rhodanese-like domain-containing protein n=1 Tax=Streptococcus didelphis TaxID=102886 RepID=UPI00037AB1A4|nr:rhodanese-like domain-containing protein [Streptococcus didelphis]WMB29961.1 rhodanese-like domain-containing protein [Streptococcus didelphis]